MAGKCLCLAAMLLLTLAVVKSSPNTGRFTAVDGSECNWFDLRLSDETMALALACTCKDRYGKSQSYGCQYSGDLYTCDKFATKSKLVFEELIQQISGIQFIHNFNIIFCKLYIILSDPVSTPCSAVDLWTQHCPDVIMTKETLQELKSPCVRAAKEL